MAEMSVQSNDERGHGQKSVTGIYSWVALDYRKS